MQAEKYEKLQKACTVEPISNKKMPLSDNKRNQLLAELIKLTDQRENMTQSDSKAKKSPIEHPATVITAIISLILYFILVSRCDNILV